MSGKNGKKGDSIACMPITALTFDEIYFMRELLQRSPGAIAIPIARSIYDKCDTEVNKVVKTEKKENK